MPTIGERLEEARKRKGVSVREASEATKIRSDYLHKFESNSFDLNLPEIYVRGFLRNYATYLKLGSEKILADYSAQAPDEARSGRRDNREIYGRMDLGQPVQADGETRSESGIEEPAPTPPSRPKFPAAPAPGLPSINPAILVKIGVAAVVLILVVVVFFSVRSSTGNSAKTPVNIKSVPEKTITFFAREAVRIKVVQDFDGAELFQGPMAKGESRSFPMRGLVILTADRIENVQVEVNGRAVSVPAMTGWRQLKFE